MNDQPMSFRQMTWATSEARQGDDAAHSTLTFSASSWPSFKGFGRNDLRWPQWGAVAWPPAVP